MTRQSLANVREQLKKLAEKEKQIEEELAVEIGKYIIKNQPEIESLKDFKDWHLKAVTSIDWIMKRKKATANKATNTVVKKEITKVVNEAEKSE